MSTAVVLLVLVALALAALSIGWFKTKSTKNCGMMCENDFSERTREILVNNTGSYLNRPITELGAQFSMIEGETSGGFINLDCNRDKSGARNALMVGLQDRHYWYYSSLKDLDHLKCAEFSQLSGLELTYTEKQRVIEQQEHWNTCAEDSVLVVLYNSGSGYFNNVDFFQCANLSAEFTVDKTRCQDQLFTPPYADYQSNSNAEEVWPMHCGLDLMPAAITAFRYNEHPNSAAFYTGIRCCPVQLRG